VLSPQTRGVRARTVALVAAASTLQLAASVSAAVVLSSRPWPGLGPVLRGRAVSAVVDAPQGRVAAVRALLDARAGALRDRDRSAWLATVDPSNRSFVQRQAALFDALADTPIAGWSYQLDPTAGPPARLRLDRRRGRHWWAPGVTVTYRIGGFDRVPTVEPQRLTFVPRAGRWLLAADDDFAPAGLDSTRGIWDGGRVSVVLGRRSIVLGHAASQPLMRVIAAGLDDAVPRVTAVWGHGWSQRVVALVPSSPAELARVVGGRGDYSQIAAVATAELADSESGYHPVGDRVVINPTTFGELGQLGRRVVLTHEVTHVATRAATGDAAPAWLVEGFADYIGYLGVPLPLRLTAAELQEDVRRGRAPTALPTDRDYDGGNPELAQVYEQGWLAVSLLAERHGRAGLLQLYRQAGQTGAPSSAVDDAMQRLWGTDLATFTDDWRRDVSARLR
jgi:hypothetical protein